jgi:ribosomal protein L11 methyltransferase
MHLWRKLAEPGWLSAHENILQAQSHGRLVTISRPERKRLQLEIACSSLNECRKLAEEFGGRIERWPRDWLERFADLGRSKPLKIGKRLLISATVSSRAKRGTYHGPEKSRRLSCVIQHSARGPSSSARLRMTRGAGCGAHGNPFLLIPASTAFGTGEHATTAMSLRLLERLTRKWKHGWSLADLGTGSGILALAAKRFGAGRVVGIDVDPKAISVAKANARLNKIDNVDFKLGDLLKWKSWAVRDIVAANLYSELLIEILPKLKRSNWLILSGVLRIHENRFFHALRRNKIEIVKVNRRGKWIAVTAKVQHASRLRIRPG